MARFVAGVALGLALGLIVTARAEDTDEVMAAATEAGVQPEDLTAALASLDAAGIKATPRSYLESVGELAAPIRPQPAASGFGPNVDARAWCVEGIESSHGRAMFNPTPVGRQHAQGYLGWLPSTAASVGVRIGDRASEWAGFRRMLAAGRGREFAGIAMGRC